MVLICQTNGSSKIKSKILSVTKVAAEERQQESKLYPRDHSNSLALTQPSIEDGKVDLQTIQYPLKEF